VLCDSGWLRRAKESRAVDVTPRGWLELKRHFDLDEASLRAA
jgi:plasmid maintenance system antidote protein VapI